MATLVTESGRRTPARLAGSAILAVQSDERLVELVRDGHERAFDAIVSRYRPALVRFCSRILPDSRTEDAVQQAFINAHSALLVGDQPAQLKSWLYTITRNAALNMLRQNGWNYDQIPLDFDGVRRPDQVVEQRIELQNTVAAVNSLPDRQRDAIVMREFEGRSYGEIAAALGANDGAVRQLLNRARGTLRTAASAIMPPPIVSRMVSSMPPSDGRRFAEFFGSIGAAGAAKVGATALVAGSLVVGAVEAPLTPTHSGSHHKTALSADHVSKASVTSVSDRSGSAPSAVAAGRGEAQSGDRHGGARPRSGDHGNGSSHHGRTPAGAREPRHSGSTRGGSGENSPRSGSGGTDEHRSSGGGSDDSSTRTGSGGSGTSGGGGSDDGTRSGPGTGSSGSGSGSDDLTSVSGSSGGGSGTSGSNDGMTTTSGSGSGTSGSDDGLSSGSGSSGSGTSGSGSTSGSDSTSGSGSSGSGTSGSGSSTSDLTSTTDH